MAWRDGGWRALARVSRGRIEQRLRERRAGRAATPARACRLHLGRRRIRRGALDGACSDLPLALSACEDLEEGYGVRGEVVDFRITRRI